MTVILQDAFSPPRREKSKKRGRRSRPLFYFADALGADALGKRRGDDGHGVDLLGVAAAGEVVDRRVQTL